MKRLAKTLLAGFLLGLLCLSALLVLTPPVSDAKAIAQAKAAANGSSQVAQMPPPRFVKALTATEDQRFFSPLDPGLDPFAVLRVAVETLSGRRGDLGGSTITQQLAKMLYSPKQRDLAAKLKEAALALKLSLAFSRKEILTMYAQVAYYGAGHYGLDAAACGYFGRHPADLNWPQAALLAGIVNAPSADNPRSHPEAAVRRRAHVFARLEATGTLTPAEAQTWANAPLDLVPAGTGCQS